MPSAAAGTAEARVRELYLDLLKRSLTDLLYLEDPLSRMVPYRPLDRSERWRHLLLAPVLALLRRAGIHPVRLNRQRFFDYAQLSLEEIRELRAGGRDWPPRAHTMIGLRRLDHLQSCVETVVGEGVPGDLLEAGVWRGGAAVLMKGVLEALGDRTRTVWLADSFRGLPPPEPGRYPADRGWDLHASPELAVSRASVESTFQAYGLLDERVRFLEGWFQDTLPTSPVARLAVLRLDGDLYASSLQVLEALYDKLEPGGFLIADDYSLPPCRAAVEEFRRARGIASPVQDIDGVGAFWRKSPVP